MAVVDSDEAKSWKYDYLFNAKLYLVLLCGI